MKGVKLPLRGGECDFGLKLKNKNNFSVKELEEYQARLRHYKNL